MHDRNVPGNNIADLTFSKIWEDTSRNPTKTAINLEKNSCFAFFYHHSDIGITDGINKIVIRR